MEKRILKLLGGTDYVPATVPELLTGLNLAPDEQGEIRQVLRALERGGRIARIKGNRYVLPQEADLVPGRIQITQQGRGFLVPDAVGGGEIAIPSSQTGTALHDDHVLVRRDVRARGLRQQDTEPVTGTVVRVLERRRTRIVGTFTRSKQFLYVVPDDPRIPHDIYVPAPRDVGRPARSGDKVVVELREWESRHSNPEGVVIEVLGAPTAEGVDMLAVLRQYDLPLKFPRPVLEEVRKFGNEVTKRDLAERTDCRGDLVVTIDPDDAKDFDDAFCLKRTGADRWKLWVHIADVSHYVKPGSALDEEARERGNSTYLVDRVVPMLPEALSNELCSLQPQVDRLTKCVEFLLSDDGQVVRSRCYAGVIHSQRRYSYEEAMAVLDGKRGAEGSLEGMLQDASSLAQKIRRRRFQNGSLDLEFPESKIRLDERGRVSRIERVEYDASHQLIEEFMLLANEAVASRLVKLKRPSLHRVHENPNPGRLREYREEVLGHNIPCGNLENPAEVQKLLRRLGKLAIGPALKIGFLKSLMRARYAVEPLGHYGLAKSHYTHFTSPIRRYADLVVHRSVFEGEMPAGRLRDTADHLSATERNSADAERDSKNVKLYAFLNAQLKSGKPQTYSALVTDIRNFGIFIDVVDLGMNGMIPLSLLADDFYEFDATRVQVHGRRRGATISLGDRLEVVVAKVDSARRRVDFVPSGSMGAGDGGRRGKGKGQRQGTSRKDGAKRKAAPGKKAAQGKSKHTPQRKGARKRTRSRTRGGSSRRSQRKDS